MVRGGRQQLHIVVVSRVVVFHCVVFRRVIFLWCHLPLYRLPLCDLPVFRRPLRRCPQRRLTQRGLPLHPRQLHPRPLFIVLNSFVINGVLVRSVEIFFCYVFLELLAELSAASAIVCDVVNYVPVVSQGRIVLISSPTPELRLRHGVILHIVTDPKRDHLVVVVGVAFLFAF